MMIMWMTMMTMNITVMVMTMLMMMMVTTMTACWLEIAIGKKLSQLNNVELEIKRKNFKSSNTSAAGASILAWVKINLRRSANPFGRIGKYFWRNREILLARSWNENEWRVTPNACFDFSTKHETIKQWDNIPTKFHDWILSFEPQTLNRFTKSSLELNHAMVELKLWFFSAFC